MEHCLSQLNFILYHSQKMPDICYFKACKNLNFVDVNFVYEETDFYSLVAQ